MNKSDSISTVAENFYRMHATHAAEIDKANDAIQELEEQFQGMSRTLGRAAIEDNIFSRLSFAAECNEAQKNYDSNIEWARSHVESNLEGYIELATTEMNHLK